MAKIIVCAEDPGTTVGGPAGPRAWRSSGGTGCPKRRSGCAACRGSPSRLRPALRGGGPPPAAPGPARGARRAGLHQRGGVRGVRRLQREEQLPLGPAARDRVRREAPHPRRLVQPGLHVSGGRLPSFVTAAAPKPPARASDSDRASAAERRRAARGRPCPRPPVPALDGPLRHLLHGHRRHRRRHRGPDHRRRPPRRRPGRRGHGPDRALPEGRCGRVRPALGARPRRAGLGRGGRGRRRPVPVRRHPPGRRRAAPRTGADPGRTVAVVDNAVTPTAGHDAVRFEWARPGLLLLEEAITERVGERSASSSSTPRGSPRGCSPTTCWPTSSCSGPPTRWAGCPSRPPPSTRPSTDRAARRADNWAGVRTGDAGPSTTGRALPAASRRRRGASSAAGPPPLRADARRAGGGHLGRRPAPVALRARRSPRPTDGAGHRLPGRGAGRAIPRPRGEGRRDRRRRPGAGS